MIIKPLPTTGGIQAIPLVKAIPLVNPSEEKKSQNKIPTQNPKKNPKKSQKKL
jgi:hypothetical protein